MDYAERYNRNRVEYLYRLAREPRLSAVAVRVGLLFATFTNADDREEVRPKYDWLMSAAHIRSRTTLSKALKELETEGYLETRKYVGFATFYSLPFDGDEEWSPGR